MKVKLFVILFLGAILSLMSSCVENVKESSFQVVHVFTDLPNSLDSALFKKFEKQSDIHVFLHHASSEYILEKIKTEKWQSNIDAVILSNALDLFELDDNNVLRIMSTEDDHVNWQPLYINPFVFNFPNDSIHLFTSYGQLIRNRKARVDAELIRSFDQWGNLIPPLKRNYLIYSLADIQGKLLYSDSLEGKDILHVQIAPYTAFKDKSKIVFPDQYYKGAIGTIGGMALIKQSKNRSNALVLYDYCKASSWRNKLAKNIGLFPILTSEENKKREILFYQNPPNLKDIKNNND